MRLSNRNLSLRNFEKTQSQRDIQLNFEGVTFNNGDYVYADSDGVIIFEKTNQYKQKNT